jgi:phage shock protein A
MWPRAIAQILELLPHVSRLVPAADRFLSARSGNDEALRQHSEQMERMAEGLRSDLGQVTASHAGLYRQMNELAAKVDDAAREARGAKDAAEALHQRLARIEAGQAKLLAAVAGSLLIALIAFIFLVFFMARR